MNTNQSPPSSSADWWQTFFQGPAVEFWLAATTPEQTELEADFLQKRLQIKPPASLIDVPCGGGRHALALANRGFSVTGVDISAEFLQNARAEGPIGNNSLGGAVEWEHREMRDLPWSNRFDGGFCFGNSFGYLDDQANFEFLVRMSEALKPGAKFALDTGYLVDTLLPNLQERGWYETGPFVVLSRRRYDPFEGRLHVEYRWIRQSNGETMSRTMSARLYSVRELLDLLEKAGFIKVETYSTFDDDPFRMGAHRLLAVATKRG